MNPGSYYTWNKIPPQKLSKWNTLELPVIRNPYLEKISSYNLWYNPLYLTFFKGAKNLKYIYKNIYKKLQLWRLQVLDETDVILLIQQLNSNFEYCKF